uniref:Tetratricopeptide repeat-like superfamily protein n=1 Tax=Davidia involucrata TaxID=16924 RepID=A0A5B6YVI4_DAVIN
MAVVLGNLALLIDVTSPRVVVADRKTRPVLSDVVLNLFKKDLHHHIANANIYAYLPTNSFESDKETRTHQVGVRSKANSKLNAVDFEGSSDDDNGNGNGFDDEEEKPFDWEKEMRKRVKEIEEMRELESKAEELQSRMEDTEAEGKEETEEEKRMRVRKELEKVAKEQAERRKTAQLMFELGQKAYGKGMYGRAIEFLEGALTIIPRPTLFGGEIQIWLAMAYEANNRHADCIALYQQLEKKHPSVSIRRQAAELRYILQAPKLKISQEEMVTIPLIGSSYDSYAGTWSDKYKDRDEMRTGSTTNQLPSTRDYLGDFLVWRPPIGLEKNQSFWAALTLWVGLVGAALLLHS